MFTIVIQGPQRSASRSAANAYRYLQFGDVVVSHWDGDDASGFDGMPVSLVSQPRPAKNLCNTYYQCLSTLKGIEAAKTKFCIKVRSDEAYTDMAPIIRKVVAAPAKMVTCNIFFRRDREYKFHPSDHVVAGDTEMLRRAFSLLKNNLEDKNTLPFDKVPEQRIFTCFLEANNVQVEWSASKKIMAKWCDVVPIEKMGSFVWSMGGHEFRHDNNPHYVKSMDDI